VFDVIGNFDEEMQYNDDVDWFLRVKEQGMKLFHQDVVVQYYRRHKNNITNFHQENQKYFMLALKKSLQRRKVAGDSSQSKLTDWLNK